MALQNGAFTQNPFFLSGGAIKKDIFAENTAALG